MTSPFPETNVFRRPPSQIREITVRTNVFYMSLVAYFESTLDCAWPLVQEITKHASTLTGDMAGNAHIVADSDLSLGCESSTRSSHPQLNSPHRELLDTPCTDVRIAMFESAKGFTGKGADRRWRPDLMVTYHNRVYSHGAVDVPKLQSLTCHIHHKFLYKYRPDELSAWIHGFWNRVDVTGACVQGLAEFAWSDAGGATAEYDVGGGGPAIWEKRLALWRFMFAQERLSKMRGVYWGTFIGKSLAQKLDLDNTFMNRFNALPYCGLISEPFGIVTKGGGYWLQLNNDILGGEPAGCQSDHIGIQNALWLERELRAKDLLW